MKKNSLQGKILFYLTVFAIFILGGVWTLQMLSLDVYYEWNKQSDIKGTSSKIVSAYKNNNIDLLDAISFEKDFCIEITENGEISYSTDSVSRGCLIYNSKEINDYKLEFMLSGKKTTIRRVTNSKQDNKILIYGIKIGDNKYAFISTSLQPIGSTVSVLKKQLVLIILIVVAVAALIAYIISKNISKPIVKITKISKEMSKGNYDIEFSTGTNIMEIQELESTLNSAAKELSKTESLRKELLANVSHDLKTPLTLIKANAEMVQDITYKDENKRNKNLDTIKEEVDRLNLLVEDILDLSKLQSNPETLKKEWFNLNELIKSIIKRFNVLCDRDGYKIEYSGFDIKILADKKRIEQVIYNLMNNAINYTGEDKTIYIEIKNIKSGIRVNVIDTGLGIREEDIDYIWDRYYKVDKKYKRVTHGTGLGLSIVKNILISHDFKYGVKNSDKKGTCFYFEVNRKSVKNAKSVKTIFSKK